MNLPVLVYDIEIVRAIPPRNGEERVEGIDYCAGWHDHANMGISVIGAWDEAEDRYRVFCADNFDEFIDLTEGRLLVGFNHIAFDNAVIFATLGKNLNLLPNYDLLQETWAAAGLSRRFAGSTHTGFGLDAICSVNFDERKSGNGALAPVLWQRGEVGQVIDYCLNDVRLTKMLLEHVEGGSTVASPKTGEPLRLMLPRAVEGARCA